MEEARAIYLNNCEHYSDIMTSQATKEAPQSTAIKQGFKQVTGVTGNSILVLNQGADYSKSMKVLEDANLRPLKHQEILLLLINDSALKESLKGKWFYIEGKGMDKNGLFTVDNKGELVERKGMVSTENIVRVWSGSNPLSFVVNSDINAAYYGRRFVLDAYGGPGVVASVVVGVAKDWKLELKQAPSGTNGREAAAPQIEGMLRVEKENTLVVLTLPTGKKKKIEVPQGTTVQLE